MVIILFIIYIFVLFFKSCKFIKFTEEITENPKTLARNNVCTHLINIYLKFTPTKLNLKTSFNKTVYQKEQSFSIHKTITNNICDL